MNHEHTNGTDHEADGEGRMYDLLCRYVFGEADEAERTEVEAALAGSEALRAQKAELDATVALVQGAFSGSDQGSSAEESASLSTAQLEELQAAAREAAPGASDVTLQPVKRGPRPWYASNSVKFAAAATVLLTVGTLYVNRQAPRGSDAEVASVEKAPDDRSGKRLQEELAWLDQDMEGAAFRPSGEETDLALLEEPEAEVAAVSSSLVTAPSPEPRLQKVEADRASPLRALGYGAPQASRSKRPAANEAPPAAKVSAGVEARRGAGGGGRDGAVTSWSDDFFLGRGEEPAGLALMGGESGRPSPGSAGAMTPAPEVAFEDESSRRMAPSRDKDARTRRPESDLRQGTTTVTSTRVPNERPRDMFFRFWGDNPFVVTRNDALSTFAADVDTASFTLARRMLREGFLPERDQIRTEEFVNFAKPDLAAPLEDTFAVYGELAPSPFGGREDRWLLRVGVRAKDITREERPPLALTFVIDTSGSMRTDNRLELVKHSLRLLVNQLDGRDTLAIVGFSNEAREILPPTPATEADTIEGALYGLMPDGGTNAEAGLKLGYQLSLGGSAHPEAQKRVIFLSDGVANLGQTDQDRLATEISEYADRGVFLNTIGVGMSNHSDVFLEQLADKGQGVCDYVADAADARRAIVERFVSGFVTVAKDLKIQVEFDGAAVLRWRQLGYENRAVADRDFRNDAVDAGEVGAGHQVTCFYELELGSNVDDAAAALAKIRLRWKPMNPIVLGARTTETRETETLVRYEESLAPSFRAASAGFRLGALSAQFAECLRQSYHARGDSMDRLASGFANLLTDAPSEDVAAMAESFKRARDLGLQAPPPVRPTDADAAQQEAYYNFLIESLGGADAPSDGRETNPSGTSEGAREGSPAAPTQEEYESRIRELLKGDQQEDPH
ncbi:von Willebrand factor [Planctomycetes bacterium Poly30]|uniref:von Willebrand factor n=1 Tax=Saltatorellus ferox TaxID=2528018 RepID=A0A518ELY3_9BACT|nr:von Willebrand factor [Planctomycetes bacterium Poly30]